MKLLVATAVKNGSDTGAQEVAEAAGEALVKVLEAFKTHGHLEVMGPIQECAASRAGKTASGVVLQPNCYASYCSQNYASSTL